jgi:hypothetical protein
VVFFFMHFVDSVAELFFFSVGLSAFPLLLLKNLRELRAFVVNLRIARNPCSRL